MKLKDFIKELDGEQLEKEATGFFIVCVTEESPVCFSSFPTEQMHEIIKMMADGTAYTNH